MLDAMPTGMCVGLDPGTTNIGIASLIPHINSAELYQVKLERNPDPIERIKEIQEVLSFCINFRSHKFTMVIEGASYGDRFRQVELEQIRTSSALWALNKNGDVKIVPPISIRKTLFGSSKIKAHEVWNEITPDAAAALSCALYPLYI